MTKLVNTLKTAAVLAPIYAASALPALAAAPTSPPIKIGFKEGDDFKAIENISVNSLVSGAISLIMLVVALVFFFMLIWGGLRWVMSQGEEKAVGAAKSQITNALIGLAIVFSAWAIMQLIQSVFGITIVGGKGLSIPKLYGP